MTTIYCIRHAEAEGNLYRIAQGQYDSILTDRGYEQVKALQKRFADIPVDAVYSSDLYRTCVTAEAVYVPKGLPLQKRKDLREINVGDWEQKTWGELARTEPEMLHNFTRHLDRWHVNHAETPEQVRDRMVEAVTEIAQKNEGKAVVVVSHGCAIRLLLATLQGYSIAQLGDTPHSDNTAVSKLEWDGEKLNVVFRDDNTHLTAENSLFATQTWWKRDSALEPGLYFQPASKKEDLPIDWAGDFDLTIDHPTDYPVLVAMMEEEPAGVLQLDPKLEADQKRGWIRFYAMRKAFRNRGLGIQLLGQAVQYFRPLGRNTLRLTIPDQNAGAVKFFTSHGFRKTGEIQDGCPVYEKSIGFRREVAIDKT